MSLWLDMSLVLALPSPPPLTPLPNKASPSWRRSTEGGRFAAVRRRSKVNRVMEDRGEDTDLKYNSRKSKGAIKFTEPKAPNNFWSSLLGVFLQKSGYLALLTDDSLVNSETKSVNLSQRT